MADFQSEFVFPIPQLDTYEFLPLEKTESMERRPSDQDSTLEEFDDLRLQKSMSWDSDISGPDSTRTTPELRALAAPPPIMHCPSETLALLDVPTTESMTESKTRKPRKTSRRKNSKKAGTKGVSNRSNSRQQFWELVWPDLEEEGWTLEPGKRKRDNDFYFYPPNTNRETARYRIDYFDSVRSVLSELEKRGQHSTLLAEYYKHEPAPKPPARENKREVKALMTTTETQAVYRGRGKRSSRKVVKYDPSAHLYATPSSPKKRCVETDKTPPDCISAPLFYCDKQFPPVDVLWPTLPPGQDTFSMQDAMASEIPAFTPESTEIWEPHQVEPNVILSWPLQPF